ncbi:hypothetical protein AQI96_26295 [Streptomyces canus]|nr:hypothetical protein AQI96_26295 [Streptomyces canus]
MRQAQKSAGATAEAGGGLGTGAEATRTSWPFRTVLGLVSVSASPRSGSALHPTWWFGAGPAHSASPSAHRQAMLPHRIYLRTTSVPPIRCVALTVLLRLPPDACRRAKKPARRADPSVCDGASRELLFEVSSEPAFLRRGAAGRLGVRDTF